MYIRKNLIPLLGVIACCISCSNDKDISTYYFPVKALENGKVYEYRWIGHDEVAPDYWYYHTLHPDPKATDKVGTFFTSTLYDPNLEVRQIVSEEVVANGMLLDALHIYLPDSSGNLTKIEPTIIKRNVYPFEVTDTTTKYSYKVHFSEPNNSNRTNYITRNRIYKGKTAYKYKGKEYDCVEFRVEEVIDNTDVTDGNLQLTNVKVEKYAKGIGLIYFSRGRQGSSGFMEYELYDIYEMSELEKKLK